MKLKNEIGALILRVTLGVLFLIHGMTKFQGGIALIIGLATRFVSILFAILMIGATLKVKRSLGLLGNGQMAGYELDLVLMVIAVYLRINGSNLLSIN
ncbi:DoxX family protein [Bacillus massilinigeriensis]|uniref:DoxX family protein n=1 Tax=Bacillus massilionigeriensis TaxID=1805475 RepID=UPI00096B1449|nr:DoxX family protein [Bacillus massilionigeriensis]